MRKTQNKKKRKKMSRFLLNKRFHIAIFSLLFGAVGAYLLLGANAKEGDPPTGSTGPNPALNVTQGCANGLDIAILIDGSGSMDSDSSFGAGKNAIRSFVAALKDTPIQFTVGYMDHPQSVQPFRSVDAQLYGSIENLASGFNASALGDLRTISNHRPQAQNLIIIITDGGISVNSAAVTAVKQAGTRLFVMGVWGTKGNLSLSTLTYIAGPNVDTGSIFTSDVITTQLNGLSNQFISAAQQLCNPPPPPPPPCTVNCDPGGPGPDGPGNDGNNSGQDGEGTGPGGGGGSSATNQGDADNATPSNSDQGDSDKQPKVEPSPFFDGKLFALGSSAEAGTGNTVGVGGLRVGYGWFYLLGLLVLLGVGGFLGWRYRKQLLGQITSLRRRMPF